jgi:hypothetical protein
MVDAGKAVVERTGASAGSENTFISCSPTLSTAEAMPPAPRAVRRSSSSPRTSQ